MWPFGGLRWLWALPYWYRLWRWFWRVIPLLPREVIELWDCMEYGFSFSLTPDAPWTLLGCTIPRNFVEASVSLTKPGLIVTGCFGLWQSTWWCALCGSYCFLMSCAFQFTYECKVPEVQESIQCLWNVLKLILFIKLDISLGDIWDVSSIVHGNKYCA